MFPKSADFLKASYGKPQAEEQETFPLNSGGWPYAPESSGISLAQSQCTADSMGTGVPFIFQIVLLLVLPLAFAYLIAVAGLALIFLRATLKNLPLHPRRRQPDSPSVPR